MQCVVAEPLDSFVRDKQGGAHSKQPATQPNAHAERQEMPEGFYRLRGLNQATTVMPATYLATYLPP